MPPRFVAALIALPLASAHATGRDIALHGTTPGHPSCSACHMPDGAGLPAAGIPRLAGTDAAYLTQALNWFAEDARRNDVMHEYARMLTAPQRAEVAAWFASLPIPPDPEPDPAPPPALVEQGKTLAAAGKPDAGIYPCATCHGPDLNGLAGLAPPLAGQSAPYIEAQLRTWHAGRQRDPGGAAMVTEAHALTAQDIAALAAYLSTKAPK